MIPLLIQNCGHWEELDHLHQTTDFDIGFSQILADIQWTMSVTTMKRRSCTLLHRTQKHPPQRRTYPPHTVGTKNLGKSHKFAHLLQIVIKSCLLVVPLIKMMSGRYLQRVETHTHVAHCWCTRSGLSSRQSWDKELPLSVPVAAAPLPTVSIKVVSECCWYRLSSTSYGNPWYRSICANCSIWWVIETQLRNSVAAVKLLS